jgi:hypothetical protein
MEDGAIADVDRSSAQGTLTDVRPVYALIKSSAFLIISPPFTIGHRLRLNVRGVECERPCAYEAGSDLLDQRQTEVTELVKTALESLGNSKNPRAINAFNHAAAQDVAGATVAFEVYHHCFCLTTSNCSLIQRFSGTNIVRGKQW